MRKTVVACDRCGRNFDYGSEEVTIVDIGNGTIDVSRVDLCGQCAEDLLSFMRNETVEANPNVDRSIKEEK